MKPLASTVDCCLILLVLQAAFRLIAAVDVPSVLCKEPVLTTVAVDEPDHRFYPYYIQLHQCQGSWNHESPNIKHCVATGYKEIKLTVYSTLQNWKKTQITMRNHTSCGPQCKATANDCDFRVQRWNDQTCKCECLYRTSSPPNDVIERKDGFRWNKHLCRYECGRPHAFCPVKKIWSREECGCVCRSFYKLNCEDDNKHMDSETCECKDPHHLMNGKRPCNELKKDSSWTMFGSGLRLSASAIIDATEIIAYEHVPEWGFRERIPTRFARENPTREPVLRLPK